LAQGRGWGFGVGFGWSQRDLTWQKEVSTGDGVATFLLGVRIYLSSPERRDLFYQRST
jgi:hypothetical protein